MSIKTEHKFSKRNHYMFAFNYYGGEPNEVIVEKPQMIQADKASFTFLWSYKSVNEERLLEDLVAVGDNKNGTVSVSGWSGKYNVLNQELFDSLVKSGAVKLKK